MILPWRRFLTWFAWFLGFLTLLVAGALLSLHLALNSTSVMQSLLPHVQKFARDQLGLALEYESFQVDVLSGLTLKGIDVRPVEVDAKVSQGSNQQPPVILPDLSLNADELKLGYAFWPLLSGEFVLDALLLESPKIVLDLDVSQAAEETTPPPVEPTEPFDVNTLLKQLEALPIAASIKRVDVTEASLDVSVNMPEGARASLSLTGLDIEVEGAVRPDPEVRLKVRVALRDQASNRVELQQANLNMGVSPNFDTQFEFFVRGIQGRARGLDYGVKLDLLRLGLRELNLEAAGEGQSSLACRFSYVEPSMSFSLSPWAADPSPSVAAQGNDAELAGFWQSLGPTFAPLLSALLPMDVGQGLKLKLEGGRCLSPDLTLETAGMQLVLNADLQGPTQVVDPTRLPVTLQSTLSWSETSAQLSLQPESDQGRDVKTIHLAPGNIGMDVEAAGNGQFAGALNVSLEEDKLLSLDVRARDDAELFSASGRLQAELLAVWLRKFQLDEVADMVGSWSMSLPFQLDVRHPEQGLWLTSNKHDISKMFEDWSEPQSGFDVNADISLNLEQRSKPVSTQGPRLSRPVSLHVVTELENLRHLRSSIHAKMPGSLRVMEGSAVQNVDLRLSGQWADQRTARLNLKLGQVEHNQPTLELNDIQWSLDVDVSEENAIKAETCLGKRDQEQTACLKWGWQDQPRTFKAQHELNLKLGRVLLAWVPQLKPLVDQLGTLRLQHKQAWAIKHPQPSIQAWVEDQLSRTADEPKMADKSKGKAASFDFKQAFPLKKLRVEGALDSRIEQLERPKRRKRPAATLPGSQTSDHSDRSDQPLSDMRLVLKQPLRIKHDLKWQYEGVRAEQRLALGPWVLHPWLESEGVETRLKVRAKGGLSPKEIQVSGAVKAGPLRPMLPKQLEVAKQLRASVKKVEIAFAGRAFPERSAELSRFSLALNQDLLKVNAKAVAGLVDTELDLSGSLDLNLGSLPAYPPLLRQAEGTLSLPFSVYANQENDVDLTARVLFDKVQAEGEGWQVQGLDGFVRLDEQLSLDFRDNQPKWLKFRYLKDENPFSRVDFNRQQPFLKPLPALKINKLKAAGQVLGPLQFTSELEQNRMALKHFDVQMLGGSVTGAFEIDTHPQRLSIAFLGRVSGIRPDRIRPFLGSKESPQQDSQKQASNTDSDVSGAAKDKDPGAEIHARVALSVGLLTGLLEGQVDVTRIGQKQLLDLLRALDPDYENEQLNTMRSALAFAAPQFVGMRFVGGLLDMSVKVAPLGASLDVYRIPVSQLVLQLSKDVVKAYQDSVPIQ